MMGAATIWVMAAALPNATAAPTSNRPLVTVVTSSTGPLRAWGDNSAGELGNATLHPSTTPVAASATGTVTTIAAGGRHDLAVLSTGGVLAWGDNTFGQLGTGVRSVDGDRETPVAVAGLTNVTSVAAGEEHSLALLRDGTVMAWGDNHDGQLGDGTTKDSAVPVAVNGLRNVKAISAGAQFSLALLTDGTVMAWGDNHDGQLGDGTTANSDVAVAAPSLAKVTAIAAGARHAIALLANGTAMAWGDNETDQLGDGQDVSTQPSSDVPVPVSGLQGVTAVAAGEQHSIALLSDGTVKAWGDNGFFELARPQGFPGGISATDVPLKVPGLAASTAIAAGGMFSLAIGPGGAVQGWGDNAFGQLGNSSTVTRQNPVTVSGLSGVSAIAAGGVSALAITSSAGAANHAGAGVSSGPPSTIWRVPTTPNPKAPHGDGLLNDALAGVSAASPADAWSVGTSMDSLNVLPLAVHWNGSAWQSTSVPLRTGTSAAELRGVDDLAPGDAWAVGVSGGDRTLIEHWNGTAWSVVPSPNPETGPGASDELQAIAGTAADDLWAIGSYSNGQTFNAVLLEHWNGTTWTCFRPPNVTGEQFGTAVTALASNDVWVVGNQATTTVSLHWDGTAWKQIATPFLNDGAAPLNLLTGVTAIAANDVWASGYESNVNQLNLRDPYVLHWTGTAWSLVKVPNPGTEGSQLAGITALSASDIWAAGVTLQTDGGSLTLTEHFDGTTWATEPSLDPGQLGPTPANDLNGIARSGAHTLFAVGTQSSPNHCCEFTLAEHANGG
jgi:alpha-tubulin suppressor-like RCC1 family protein